MTYEHHFSLLATSGAWCARMRREHPDLQVDVVSIFPCEDGDIVETIDVRGREAIRAFDTIRFADAVRSIELLHQAEDRSVIRLRTAPCEGCRLVGAASASPVFPLRLGSEGCHWRILASAQKGREIAATLTAGSTNGARLTAKRAPSVMRPLTHRQREILVAAVREGYYARPRQITLSGLADKLGIRKSTLSQSLATTEAKLMPRHLYDGEDRRPASAGTEPVRRKNELLREE